MSGFKNKLLSLTIIYLFQSSMGLNVYKAKHNPNFTFNTFFFQILEEQDVFKLLDQTQEHLGN